MRVGSGEGVSCKSSQITAVCANQGYCWRKDLKDSSALGLLVEAHTRPLPAHVLKESLKALRASPASGFSSKVRLPARTTSEIWISFDHRFGMFRPEFSIAIIEIRRNTLRILCKLLGPIHITCRGSKEKFENLCRGPRVLAWKELNVELLGAACPSSPVVDHLR